MTRPLNIGSIGVGGYAAGLIRGLDRLIDRERARLAVVDVAMSRPDEPIKRIIDEHGTAMVKGVDALLDFDGLDAVLIATSIDSHLPLTQAALERGLHVHCEKPITATIQDARRMIAARDAADRVVHVGFQDTYSPSVQWAKRQLLNGAIGSVNRVVVHALWPRPDSYYNRNQWAGRLRRDGRWVLDSPANNALIHQLNMALYLTGEGSDASNRVTHVEAELYRARPIENYDTCAMRCRTAAGPELLILLSHAAATMSDARIDFLGESGELHRLHPDTCRIERDGQTVDQCDDGDRGSRGSMFDNLLDHIAGTVARSRCEIENAIEPTRLVNAASQAAVVHPIGREHIDLASGQEGEDDYIYAIRDINAVFERCRADFALPSEIGAAWARRGGAIDTTDFEHFAGPPTA